MTNLEIILTIAVWAVVAGVFYLYRSLAVRQLREQDSKIRHEAQVMGDGRP